MFAKLGKKIERIILNVNKMLPVYRMVQLDQMPFVYIWTSDETGKNMASG